ncbi:MAG: magnesium transporter, partial [Arcobacter sp.]
MQNIIENENLKEKLFNEIKSFKENKTIISHPYDLAKDLEKLRDENEHEYKYICKKMPSELFAEVLCEMPSYVQEEITEIISEKKVANITSKMDSDDASALIQNISHKDEEYAEHILERLDDEDKQIIEKLNSYSENECGHFMQSEFFKVYEDESIEEAIIRLKELKKTNILDNIFHAHIVNKEEKFIGSLGFEELILYKHSQKFSEISKEKLTHYVINDKADIDDAVEMFS